MKIKDNKKGFSLVELMIVVTIMGILLSVVITGFAVLQKHHNANLCHLSQQTFYQKSLNYHGMRLDKNTYPDEFDDYGMPLDREKSIFLDGVTSFNSKTDELENSFKESFIDYLDQNEFMPKCPIHDNYYIIQMVDGELTISCYDKDGSLEQDHNNSTIF